MEVLSKDKLEEYTSQAHYGDIETVGFWDDVHTIKDVHVLCSITDDDTVILWHDNPDFDNKKVLDPDDGKEYIIPPRAGTLIDGFRYWYTIGRKKGTLSVHNCSTYDKTIVEKVISKCKIPKSQWRDTFNQSKIQFFDRPCPRGAKSAHGLLAYGIKFGIKKPPIDDFKTMTPYILHRVIEDCHIQKKTQLYLDKEAAMLLEKGIDFSEGQSIEDEYAENCAYQEIRGVLADKVHMEECVTKWDISSDLIAAEVEPQLPPTCKASGVKCTRKELMALLGFPNSPADVLEEVKKDGIMVWQPIKPYYTPSVNFHRVEKQKYYSGFHISYGDSPSFKKKNELTTWIKEMYPDTKSKEWDIGFEEKETKLLNKNTCEYFGVEETDTDIIIGAHTRVKFTPSKMTQHEVVKGFLIKLGLKHVDTWNLKKDSEGSFIRASEDMIVSYPPKASPENQLHINIKRGEAVVTSPKIGEGDYEQLPEGLGRKIGEYNTTVHRRRFLLNPKDPDEKGLLAKLRSDNRLPAGVFNSGTSTLRASHRTWVNAAGAGALYGEDIRKCLIPPEGRVLVGADMKSAQLAIAAYYAKNSTYYNAVASGQEVVKSEDGSEIYCGASAHCFSARLFDLVSHQEWQDAIRTQDAELLHSIMLRRKKSKSASFGVIFGCSGKKLAGMLGVPENQGNEKKNAFLTQMGLQGVSDWLLGCKEKYKRGNGWYIPIPFGYWVFCKSDHKSINYIIQGTEAACQKVAVNYFERKLKESGLDAFKVLDYHKLIVA